MWRLFRLIYLKILLKIKKFSNNLREKWIRLSVRRLLNECCYLKGIQTNLIHSVISQFNSFYNWVIFHPEKIFEDKLYPITNEVLIEKIQNFEQDGDKTILRGTQLFYDYCKVIYMELV